MAPRNDQRNEPIDLVEVVMSWGLIGLAIVAVLGASLRAFGPGASTLTDRLDQTTLLYVVVAGVLLMLRHIKTFSMGQLKFEMIEKLRERQEKQEERLADMTLILPFLLPQTEAKHIKNLAAGKTKYHGNDAVRTELRRLRSIGLVSNKPNRTIGDIKNGAEVDLADYLELTTLGKRWAAMIQDIEAAELQQAA